MARLSRSSALLLLGFALACSGTESTAPPLQAIVEPAGWIYFQDGQNEDDPIRRIDVATGAIETLVSPPPLLSPKRFPLWPHMVSSQTGEIAASAPAGGSFPATMIWNHLTDDVVFHRDPSVTVDNFHRWSPDGRTVAFLRRSAEINDGRSRVIRLDPSTGRQDTLHVTPVGRSVKWFSWLGNDTLLLDIVESGRPSEFYDALQLSNGVAAPFREVPSLGLGLPPTFSADRRWIAFTLPLDSAVAPADSIVHFRRRMLGDRVSRTAIQLKLDELFSFEGNLTFEFSPDSRFLITCPNNRLMVIRRLPSAEEVKRLEGVFCWAVSWSWGPEGPPSGG